MIESSDTSEREKAELGWNVDYTPAFFEVHSIVLLFLVYYLCGLFTVNEYLEGADRRYAGRTKLEKATVSN